MIRAPSGPGEIRLWGGETGAVYLGPQPKAGVFPEVLPNLQPGFAARGMTVPPGPSRKGQGFSQRAQVGPRPGCGSGSVVAQLCGLRAL